jgi:hypothetical protein
MSGRKENEAVVGGRSKKLGGSSSAVPVEAVRSVNEAMTQALEEERVPNLPRTRRVESFSDAAFSIIITLLVLEIHRPTAAPGRLGHELAMGWSS